MSMTPEEKKWKRGDIGPDGRVFWAYNKTAKNGEYWLLKDKFDSLSRKSKASDAILRRSGKRKEYSSSYRKKHSTELSLKRSAHYHKNKKDHSEYGRRNNRRKSFLKEDGSSFDSWFSSLLHPSRTFASIANLQPDPGQTLAELIHELSGYAMDVCELIANPPVIEDSPALTPLPAEDLF